MHERGYTYIGPTAIAKLTLPEIRTLYTGWEVTQQLKYDEAHGIDPAERSQFEDFVDDIDHDGNPDAVGGPTRATANTPGMTNVTPPGMSDRRSTSRSFTDSTAHRRR